MLIRYSGARTMHLGERRRLSGRRKLGGGRDKDECVDRSVRRATDKDERVGGQVALHHVSGPIERPDSINSIFFFCLQGLFFTTVTKAFLT
jgi:hypothetical protein